jgi:hypothetical protein
MKNDMHYDIIADIHGRFDKLSALMERLGYIREGEGFLPPAGHQALFLGDLIDPKPGYPSPGGVRDTLRAVKAMCDRGDALCLMGNHEYNAIYFHSKGPDGKWLRIRGSKNIAQHQGTLDDFPDYDDPASEWQQVWIPWMKRLPFSLDLGEFRAVHACWHPEHLRVLEGKSLEDPEFFLACTVKKSREYEAIEAVLKGIEVPLPEPHYFIDHTGTIRKHFRSRWWEAVSNGQVCCDLVFPGNSQIKDWPVTDEARQMFQPYNVDAPPVFVGHYYKPANAAFYPERHNVACLDYSAAVDGPLVAYLWNGEQRINAENYIGHS